MKNLLTVFFIVHSTLSFAQSAESKMPPPTNAQVRALFAQLWEKYLPHAQLSTTAQQGQNPWKNPALKIKIRQCQSVDGALAPSYLCDFTHLPTLLFPDLSDPDQPAIKQPISFRFEQNSWQLKAPLHPPPTEEEIKTALDQIWLTEKTESMNDLIKNRKLFKNYAPTPGYGLPKTESNRQHQKRLKTIENLPDHPFATSRLRINNCTESDIFPYDGFTPPQIRYICELNKDDLKANFSIFAKNIERNTQNYQNYLKKHAKKPDPRDLSDPEKEQYYLEAIYHNKQWIIGRSNLDPLLSTFQHMNNFDGCNLPRYRPK